MSLLNEPFEAARRTLGVGPTDPLSIIRRAYRKATAEHPPDREPEAFARIRAAFEVLSNPLPTADKQYYSKAPMIEPPELPKVPDPGDVLVAALRHTATQIPSDALLAPKDLK